MIKTIINTEEVNLPNFIYRLEYAADYFPYGKVLREWNPQTEKYLTTHHERDIETGLDYRGARYYDSDVARFLSLDPMAANYVSWSSYNYVLGNPLHYIDPTGKSANPIYNTDGELLGTDDKGLQGDALVLNENDFTQGMSHSDAVNKNLGLESLNNQNARDNYKTTQNSLPGRPDYDGVVTLSEAIGWYNSGSGKPLFVDAGKMNFKSSDVSVEDFGNNNNLSVNFFSVFDNHKDNSNIKWRPSSDYTLANVYGTLGLKLENANTGAISLITSQKYGGGIDRYDFSSSFFSGLADYSGRGTPKSFNFMGYGKGSINISAPTNIESTKKWLTQKF